MTLKTKLAQGEVTVGSWISLGDTATAEIFCNAGFDWVVVDLEHSAIDLSRTAELIRIVDLAGATPLTRLTSNNPDQIKRVMDAGAAGIVVPMVNSREDAEQLSPPHDISHAAIAGSALQGRRVMELPSSSTRTGKLTGRLSLFRLSM